MLQIIESMCVAQLHAADSLDALTQIDQHARARGVVGPQWLKAVKDREDVAPTGLPTSIPVAIPHTDPEHVITPGIGIFTFKNPVTFNEMGSLEATVDVQIVMPLFLQKMEDQASLLAVLVTRLQDQDFMASLLAAGSDAALVAAARQLFPSQA